MSTFFGVGREAIQRNLEVASMEFVSFVGRVLFISFFFLSVWQEFNIYGIDGGPVTKNLVLKFTKFLKPFTTHIGFQEPEFMINVLVGVFIALKGIGSLLFIFGSTIGAFLLILHQLITTPIIYDFYNYDMEKKAFTTLLIKFTQNLALLGGLIFFIGMKTTIERRLMYKNALKSKIV